MFRGSALVIALRLYGSLPVCTHELKHVHRMRRDSQINSTQSFTSIRHAQLSHWSQSLKSKMENQPKPFLQAYKALLETALQAVPELSL